MHAAHGVTRKTGMFVATQEASAPDDAFAPTYTAVIEFIAVSSPSCLASTFTPKPRTAARQMAPQRLGGRGARMQGLERGCVTGRACHDGLSLQTCFAMPCSALPYALLPLYLDQRGT